MTYHAARTGADPGAPLFFTFHGTGADQHQFHALGRTLVPEAHVVSPRGDVNEGGALRFFRRVREGVYDMEDLATRVEAMAAFLAAEKDEAQPARTYGLGYSNGANILAATAFSHPGIVDWMILMHPLIPWTPDPQPGLAGRRVLITAGRNDQICPAPQTEDLARWFKQQGAEVLMHWHDGGHEIHESEVAATKEFVDAR